MKLAEHLSLRTPLVWVTTDEPGRVIDVVIESSGRSTFRLDALRGLINWDATRKRWVQVLIADPMSGEEGPCHDPQMAFAHVVEQRGVMLLENAHTLVERMAGFFLSIQFEFRDAFYADDLDKVPTQFVLLSFKDEVPGEIARMTAHLYHELPDEEDLIELVGHLSNELRSDSTCEDIARAGVGLSESEFISSALLNVKESGAISAPYINSAKVELLKNNGILEVRTPELGIDALGGMDNAKDLIEQIDWIWKNSEEAKALNINPLRRLMMVGVPGTGKSLICEAIASILDLDLGKGGVSNAMSKWVGESEANMRRMFSTLKRMAPIVFWIDEFGRDMSGGMSSGSVDGGTTDRVHGEFLTGLQELPSNIFLAAAANRIEDLPPEMTRADRFDKIMFVGFPTSEEREEIFRIHLGSRASEHNLMQLSAATPFFTGAEIKGLINEVRFSVGTRERRAPTTEEIVQLVPHIKGRVWNNHREPIVAMYHRAKIEWDWASSGQQAEADEVLTAAKNPVMAPVGKIPQYKPANSATKPAEKEFNMKWGS